MKAKKYVFAGSAIWLSTNNNWELSNDKFDENFAELKKQYPELKKDCWSNEVIEAIRNAPRTGRSSHGKLTILDEAGKEAVIGCKILCKEGEKANDHASSAAVPEEIWLDISKHWAELSEETKQYIKAVSPKVAQKVQMAEDYGFDSLEEMQKALDSLKKKNAAKKA